MRRTVKNVVALVTVLLLVFIAACAPAPGEVTPPPTPEPTPTPTQPTPTPSPVPEANFRLLISDEVNAIGDFESLVVTITSVGVHMGGETGEWLERSPATEELDLVPLQEENAQEIWSGTLPDGQYTMVFVYVSDIDATLNNGDPVEMKLPSEKLHINTHFTIPEDSPVSFVFDISVVAAGGQQSDIKYILKPVVSQSGPNQNFTEVSLQERDRDRERERESELDLEIIEGDIAPGETVTLLVTFDGEPVAGATVEVNDEEIDNTGDDGTVSFTIPEDAGEVEIEARLDELKGELELEVEEG